MFVFIQALVVLRKYVSAIYCLFYTNKWCHFFYMVNHIIYSYRLRALLSRTQMIYYLILSWLLPYKILTSPGRFTSDFVGKLRRLNWQILENQQFGKNIIAHKISNIFWMVRIIKSVTQIGGYTIFV